MRLLIISFLVGLTTLELNGQSCLPNGIEFNDQESIDNFAINNPNCTIIDGVVRINGFGNEITSLNGLSQIIQIDSTLEISFTNLTNLEGLEGLEQVGSLEIIQNASLLSLSGLNGLDTIDGDFFIGGNNNIESLSGLTSLSFIDGNLDIDENKITDFTGLERLKGVNGDLSYGYVTNYTGLDNLIEISGDFTIGIHDELSLNCLSSLSHIGGSLLIEPYQFLSPNTITNLEGLNNLESIGWSLSIVNNPGLTSLAGLESLKSVGGDLKIDSNENLELFLGLTNLKAIGVSLIISNNKKLTSLEGINNDAEINGLYIAYNDLLNTCSSNFICQYLSTSQNESTILENSEGCNNKEEILEQCPSPPLSINDNKKIAFYPNPVTNKLFISPEIPVVFIQLISLEGALVLNMPLVNGEIDLSEFQKGIYILKINTASSSQVSKLIIQ